jgi:hypothetical protein
VNANVKLSFVAGPASVAALALLGIVSGAAGCGGGSASNGKWPPLPPGCPVQVLREAPTGPTENIGPVSASCSPDIAQPACERTLADQTCKLGGDVVWGVTRIDEAGKYRLFGRAAHTTAAK